MERNEADAKAYIILSIIFICGMLYNAAAFKEVVRMRGEFESLCNEVASISMSDRETVKQEINNIITKHNMEDSDITLLYDNASKKEYIYIDYIQNRGKRSYHRTRLIDLENTK